GHKPLVLERRNTVGGCAVTEEIHKGFRCPTVLHTAGPLDARVVRDLNLAIEWLKPDVRVFAPAPDGRAAVLYDDAARTAEGLKALSEKDAQASPQFAACFARIGKALSPLLASTPPSTDSPSGRDLWNMLKLGKRLRGLGKKDLYRVLRWGPMAVADLV